MQQSGVDTAYFPLHYALTGVQSHPCCEHFIQVAHCKRGDSSMRARSGPVLGIRSAIPPLQTTTHAANTATSLSALSSPARAPLVLHLEPSPRPIAFRCCPEPRSPFERTTPSDGASHSESEPIFLPPQNLHTSRSAHARVPSLRHPAPAPVRDARARAADGKNVETSSHCAVDINLQLRACGTRCVVYVRAPHGQRLVRRARADSNTPEIHGSAGDADTRASPPNHARAVCPARRTSRGDGIVRDVGVGVGGHASHVGGISDPVGGPSVAVAYLRDVTGTPRRLARIISHRVCDAEGCCRLGSAVSDSGRSG
ncbi:hypothetical protein C8Q80DRAFT_596600 [Daedaleopsis nitida]|nr:hypothetical protein C8Q80DRAFT_596600 [Daedaleopsis nitida]